MSATRSRRRTAKGGLVQAEAGIVGMAMRVYFDSTRGLVALASRDNEIRVEYLGSSVQNLIAAKRPIKGFLHMGDSILTHNTWDRLSEIKAPTLLMGGEEDIITPPRHMQAMAKLMPNAEARMFPKTLHGFMVEKPAAAAMIPEFFRQH